MSYTDSWSIDRLAPKFYNDVMTGPKPSYQNMERFFIRLKAGKNMSLTAALQLHLHVSATEAQQLISQGSVWDGERKVRLKDENMIITSQLLRVDRPKFIIHENELLLEDIKYEDRDLLIVFKRGGVAVQPTPTSDIDCLLHGVQQYYNRQGMAYRAAPINRLDLPAQGLVFFAKNKPIEIALHLMFQERKVRKRYLAATPAFTSVKSAYIIRSSMAWQGRVKEALTYVRFCREKDGLFYFLVFPQTGRTHQIRRHFQEWLVPLSGDHLYGNYSGQAELGLICFYYSFRHPVSAKKTKVSFLPPHWRQALDLPE
ncbi:MAG: RluA family pseudouridine synthase [Chrysiogenales bacterium]